MSSALNSTVLERSAEAFLARYEGLRGRLAGDAAVREAAKAAFRTKGLPGPREEAWRYTALRQIAQVQFAEPLTLVEECADLLALVPAIDAPRLVFVDGRFREDLSSVPDGVAVRVGGPSFGTLADPDRHQMVALNTMLAEDGAEITVAAGMDAATLVLVSLGTAGAARASAFHPRHAITLGRGSKLVLVDVAIGKGVYFNNSVTSASVGEDAALTHLRLQMESEAAFSVATLYAEVAARGSYDGFTLTLGAQLSRAEIHARLAGPDAIAHLNAARLMRGTQHGDFTTVVRHDAPNCASRQTVKTVLAGKSRGVFQGKIEVARVAQKTDGYQMNQAMLLSPDAEMNSKPQLEIYADDVKCSHGATVGEIDPEQLFYLRSRGVPEATARMMLIRAFLAEAIDGVAHDEARAAMETAISAWWERGI